MSSLDQESLPREREQKENDKHQRGALLVVAGLIVAVTFQAALQPPGGTNATGVTNLSGFNFRYFAFCNTICFVAAMLYVHELMIGGFRPRFMVTLCFFAMTATYTGALISASPMSERRWIAIVPLVIWIVLSVCQCFRAFCFTGR